MAKRIVKRIHANGRIDYTVESNRRFGFIPTDWHIVTMHPISCPEVSMDAVFKTYKEACAYAGIPLEKNRTIEEVVKTE